MLPNLHDDPERWFECANKMRVLASELMESDGRVMALKVAKDLDWLAEWLVVQNERSKHPTARRNGSSS
jgi:hypothetical protein